MTSVVYTLDVGCTTVTYTPNSAFDTGKIVNLAPLSTKTEVYTFPLPVTQPAEVTWCPVISNAIINPQKNGAADATVVVWSAGQTQPNTKVDVYSTNTIEVLTF